jgi:6-pyruvoyltetrahydropterin/6-carboxytetrahydropterin synthase
MHFLITRKNSFEAAHRLMDHQGKCRNLHGHRYEYKITLRISNSDTTKSIALDFTDIKKTIDDYIDFYFDHATFVNPADTKMLEFLGDLDSKIYILTLNNEYCITTAENIAKEIYLTAQLMFQEAHDISIESVILSETAKNSIQINRDSISSIELEMFTKSKSALISDYLAHLDL